MRLTTCGQAWGYEPVAAQAKVQFDAQATYSAGSISPPGATRTVPSMSFMSGLKAAIPGVSRPRLRSRTHDPVSCGQRCPGRTGGRSDGVTTFPIPASGGHNVGREAVRHRVTPGEGRGGDLSTRDVAQASLEELAALAYIGPLIGLILLPKWCYDSIVEESVRSGRGAAFMPAICSTMSITTRLGIPTRAIPSASIGEVDGPSSIPRAVAISGTTNRASMMQLSSTTERPRSPAIAAWHA